MSGLRAAQVAITSHNKTDHMKTRPFGLAGLAIVFLLNSPPLHAHETPAIPAAALAKLDLKNGENVGTWMSEALSPHIELQEKAKTPQYQRALQVAEFNRERNSGPVCDLRGGRSVFLQVGQWEIRCEFDEARAVDALGKRLEGLAKRVKSRRAAAIKIEGKIFKVNQPKPREYRLKRVALAPKPGKAKREN